LEDSDKEDLLNPDKIVYDGGQVFFALENQNAIGTVAMIKSSDDKYELAKMTVQDNFRGKGIANMLMDECLKFAKENKAKEIFLISNDSLTIARNLYDKYGFKEVDLDSQKYDRGNVKMRLTLE
jgi:ribosomal protein S18 acetylase RimI-like enzyme